ncbi:head-tail connector protein [Rhodobacter sp. SY28-1]|uniref:head-tail connector protein n=1 Tax=Rhodobacter sp. SY28-1 TaxID=2562317 RepID=UPI0014854F05|nr:head-tail connector protein [Rhodobacter sp. SY28-1]
MPLSLALIRAHLNLERIPTEDPLLTHYGNVAAAWVQAYTAQPFDHGNALMVQAALLMVAHQYESREAVTFGSAYQLPFGVHELLSPLKNRVTGHRQDLPAEPPLPPPALEPDPPAPDPDADPV